MKVLKELIYYLESNALLSAHDVSWLRNEGFIELEGDDPPDDDDYDYDYWDQMREDEHWTELDEAIEAVEQDRTKRREAERIPKSSKGARKSRRRRRNASATAKQQRDGRRHQAEKRRVSAIESLQGKAAISALRDALNDLRPKVVVAALAVLAEIRPPMSSTLQQKLTELSQHTNSEVRDAASEIERRLSTC